MVDEKALADALRYDRIHGAGLDVFSAEPLPAGSVWAGLDNVIVTPHMAGQTKEAAAAVSTMAAEGVLAVLSGKRWPNVANPAAYGHPRWQEGRRS